MYISISNNHTNTRPAIDKNIKSKDLNPFEVGGPRYPWLDSEKNYYWFKFRENHANPYACALGEEIELFEFWQMPHDQPLVIPYKSKLGTTLLYVTCYFTDGINDVYYFKNLTDGCEFMLPMDKVNEVFKIISFVVDIRTAWYESE